MNQQGILHPPRGLFPNELGQPHVIIFIRRLTQIGHDHHLVNQLLGKLRLYIKITNTFHLVPEKVYPHRTLFRKRIDIHDTPPDRKLPGFIHEIIPFETVLSQQRLQKRYRQLVPLNHGHRHISQHLLTHHLLGHRLRVSNHHPHLLCRQGIQHLCPNQN